MKLKSIKEYLDNNGNLSKPKITLNGDNSLPVPSKPEKSERQKSLDGVIGPEVHDPKDYVSKDVKNPTKDELGDAGDKDLIYVPDTDTTNIERKLKNIKFVKENSNVKINDYQKNLCNIGGSYSIEMTESAKIACENERAMELFLHEVVKENKVKNLIECLSTYKEFFSSLKEFDQENDNKLSNKLN